MLKIDLKYYFSIVKIKYIAICILFVFSNLCSYGQNKNSVPSKPNILFIIADDLQPALGAYGKSQIVSPNIDRLARKGQWFTQHYDNYPNCGPTRASLLSGLYPSRSRWKKWTSSQDQAVPGIVSLPMYFKNNGYKTVSLSKVYNNFADGKGSWDEKWRPPTTTTSWDYQSKEGIRIFEKRNNKRDENLKPRNKHNLPNRGPAYEKADVKDIAYRDGRTATRAIETLQDFRNSGHSFFLAVGFHGAHLPFSAPEKYWEMYDKEDIQLPPNMHPPKGAPDVSMTNSGELRAYAGVPNKGPIPDSLARKLIHGYYAQVSYMDQQVGRVLNELEGLGLDNNTIIVFWGEHGYSLGKHGLWGKHTNYRVANHIPLILKVPGKKSGIRQDGLTGSVDIYPTLADLAGLAKPVHLQGKSFADKLDNPQMDGKGAVFWKAPTGRGETIITQNYSYTEFFDDEGNQIARMLYDVREDPQENVNIAERPENKEVIKKLHKRLRKHMKDRNIIRLP